MLRQPVAWQQWHCGQPVLMACAAICPSHLAVLGLSLPVLLPPFGFLGLSLWTDMSPHKDALDILQMFFISLYLVEVYHLP